MLQGMELKGQMVFCPESDSLLFIASPFLDGLEGLTGRGLYISDIPIHDATRDVILVGEQSRAQVRLTSNQNNMFCKTLQI
jgi:guanylate cyclase soluble subunit alpha